MNHHAQSTMNCTDDPKHDLLGLIKLGIILTCIAGVIELIGRIF